MTDITVHRPGMTPETSGPAAYWPDGLTTYTIRTRTGRSHGVDMADEAASAIAAVDSLRAGEEIPRDALTTTLEDVRRLSARLAALEGELILYARETGPEGGPRLSWAEIGDPLRLHRSTVREHWARMAGGTLPEWRRWLTQGTARAELYEETPIPGAAPSPTGAAPGTLLVAEAVTLPSGGYVITVTDPRTGARDHSMVMDTWEEFRHAAACARLSEHGYEVVPAARTDRDRRQFSGWKPEPGFQAFSVPVYRVPDAETQGTPAPSASPADIAEEIAGKLGMPPRGSDR